MLLPQPNPKPETPTIKTVKEVFFIAQVTIAPVRISIFPASYDTYDEAETAIKNALYAKGLFQIQKFYQID